jgi:hypothetical protein
LMQSLRSWFIRPPIFLSIKQIPFKPITCQIFPKYPPVIPQTMSDTGQLIRKALGYTRARFGPSVGPLLEHGVAGVELLRTDREELDVASSHFGELRCDYRHHAVDGGRVF